LSSNILDEAMRTRERLGRFIKELEEALKAD
jgi:hypothetical protein